MKVSLYLFPHEKDSFFFFFQHIYGTTGRKMPLLSPSESYLILFYFFHNEMLPQPHSSPTGSKTDESSSGKEGKALESEQNPV